MVEWASSLTYGSRAYNILQSGAMDDFHQVSLEIELAKLPRQTPYSRSLYELWLAHDKLHLPRPGGLLDQPAEEMQMILTEHKRHNLGLAILGIQRRAVESVNAWTEALKALGLGNK